MSKSDDRISYAEAETLVLLDALDGTDGSVPAVTEVLGLARELTDAVGRALERLVLPGLVGLTERGYGLTEEGARRLETVRRRVGLG